MVAMIGIGYYPNGGILGNLIGIKNEYKNMIQLFVEYCGYSMIYENDKNEIKYLTKKKLIENNNFYNNNFKIKWNENDIKKYIKNVKKNINIYKPDSLIFIISSHGDSEKVIIDSNFDEHSLMSIYSEFWNINGGCPYLADKPKIFIIDACQGRQTPIPNGLLTNTNNNNNNTNIDNDNINNVESEINITLDETNDRTIDESTELIDESKNSKQELKNDSTDESSLESKESNDKMTKKHLKYENFCYIYGNIEDYAVVDAGIKGSHLLLALKNVILQKNIEKIELNQIIGYIRDETLRLVKGESKKWKKNYKKTNSCVRQIVECTINMSFELYFSFNK